MNLLNNDLNALGRVNMSGWFKSYGITTLYSLSLFFKPKIPRLIITSSLNIFAKTVTSLWIHSTALSGPLHTHTHTHTHTHRCPYSSITAAEEEQEPGGSILTGSQNTEDSDNAWSRIQCLQNWIQIFSGYPTSYASERNLESVINMIGLFSRNRKTKLSLFWCILS